MKICILGPGAMGCLFGVCLIKSGNEVFFLDKDEKRIALIKKKGILLEKINKEKIKINKEKINITTIPEKIGVVDLLLVFVKSHQTERAIQNVQPLIGKETTVLSLQNGLGNIELICKFVNKKNVICGITSQGATLLDVGRVSHRGEGETIIGELNNKITPRLKKISNLFNSAEIKTKITKNVEGLIWSKLIINVGINALAAILEVRNGVLLENSFSEKILEELVKEAEEIAMAKKIKLFYKNPLRKVKEICKLTSSNINSTLQDILRKKKTEIDFINGAIQREGEKLGIPTPVNKTLTYLIKAKEKKYDFNWREN